ncbi:MAG: hypothetical protein RL318_1477 [Fibrobacterota bacterium]|jgi:zinc transport system substrate-binding protein
MRRLAWAVALLGLGLSGCGQEESHLPGKTKIAVSTPPVAGPESLHVAAATGPMAWLVCQVAGAPCQATVLVPSGASAHTFEPKPSLLSELRKSQVYFSSGLAFEEGWVPRLKSGHPSLKVVALQSAEALPSEDHDHGHGERNDPHVWSSPRSMLSIVDSISLALTRNWPDQTDRFQLNRDSTRARLLRLDTLVRRELAPFSGKHFYINHPELGYLAHDYGLIQEPLEEGGREPSLTFLLNARKVARVQGIRAVFVQGSYGVRTAQALARELNVPLVEIDLYATPWDSAIVRVARQLASNL